MFIFGFLQLRPLDNPLRGPTDLQLALDTGTSVADMVTEMEMEDQVVLMSTEPIKLVVAKRQNHHLQTNVIFFTRYWQLSSSQYAEIKKYYKIYLPGLSECLDNLPNDKSMMDFLFSSGTLLYSTEATSTGVFIDMFLDSKVNQGKDLFKILGNSLVPTISIGSGVVDWLETPNALKAAQDKLWPKLIKQGIQSLLTDDWLRLKGIIGRGEWTVLSFLKEDVCKISTKMLALFCRLETYKLSIFT